jgi:hypothetical protein
MARASKGPKGISPRGDPARNTARVANGNSGLKRTVAPWPLIDRWPILLGSNLSLQYLASVYRVCQNGYRQQYVDALDELLERDPHTQSVLEQRTLAVAGGRVELTPAPDPNPKSARAKRAKEITEDLQRRIDAIPARTQAFYGLCFSALYYGAGASEVHWALGADGWNVVGLGFIHSRRVAWPDQNDWSAHIWDQGAVMPTMIGLYPTENFFGLRVRDAPGKILLHTPTHRADYPTRDGLGRTIGFWQVIKNMAIRGAAQYVERFGKPWAIGTYSTVEASTDKPRAADDNDIKALEAALAALGVGSLSGASLPDSVKITLLGPGISGTTNGINHEKLIALCDEQISKAIRGGTLQVDAGDKGARSLGEVHAESDVRNARYDACCLADTLRGGNNEASGGIVWWLCHLNYPGEEDLCPGVTVHVEQISPDQMLDRAVKLAAVCGAIDAKPLAEMLGIKLVDPADPDAVRLAPLKPTDLFALLPATSTSLTTAVEALASMVGVNLSPALKSSLASMDRDGAARLVQELLGRAKAIAEGASAEGASAEGAAEGGPQGGSPGDGSAETDEASAAEPSQPTAPKRASKTGPAKAPAHKPPRPSGASKGAAGAPKGAAGAPKRAPSAPPKPAVAAES